MKKISKRLLALGVALVLLFSVVSFGGCSWRLPWQSREFERGFEYYDRFQSNSASGAVRSDRREFYKDDVTLEFFFGWANWLADWRTQSGEKIIVSFALFFHNTEGFLRCSHRLMNMAIQLLLNTKS